jgi:hypothetical protein
LQLLRQGELPRQIPAPRRGAGAGGESTACSPGRNYVYFIDEIFLANKQLLQGLVGKG